MLTPNLPKHVATVVAILAVYGAVDTLRGTIRPAKMQTLVQSLGSLRKEDEEDDVRTENSALLISINYTLLLVITFGVAYTVAGNTRDTLVSSFLFALLVSSGFLKDPLKDELLFGKR